MTAIAGLAACLFERGEVDRACALLQDAPADIRQASPIKAVLAKIDLAGRMQHLDDLSVLERCVQDNAKDWQARFDLVLVCHWPLSVMGKGNIQRQPRPCWPLFAMTATGMMMARASNCWSFLQCGDQKARRGFRSGANCWRCCFPDSLVGPRLI